MITFLDVFQDGNEENCISFRRLFFAELKGSARHFPAQNEHRHDSQHYYQKRNWLLEFNELFASAERHNM
jgi:hypothetical protein